MFPKFEYLRCQTLKRFVCTFRSTGYPTTFFLYLTVRLRFCLQIFYMLFLNLTVVVSQQQRYIELFQHAPRSCYVVLGPVFLLQLNGYIVSYVIISWVPSISCLLILVTVRSAIRETDLIRCAYLWERWRNLISWHFLIGKCSTLWSDFHSPSFLHSELNRRISALKVTGLGSHSCKQPFGTKDIRKYVTEQPCYSYHW